MPLKSVRIPLFTSARLHLKFAHKRIVTSSGHEGTPAWTKAKPSLSIHRKTYRPAEARIYHSCVELAIFIGKECASEIQPLNTPHDQLPFRHVKQMTPVWRSSISHARSPAKTITRIFLTGGGGHCDTCHQDNVVTWQRRLRLLSIQTLNCF